jgi:sigma-54 dependent transcriptional regulator, acetoin dehydrogenase operon transcriptional activator AcoR
LTSGAHIQAHTWRRGGPPLVQVPSPTVREEIVQSRLRSALCGLEPDDPLTLPFEALPATPTRLQREARVTVDELASLVLPSGFAVLLASSRGQLVEQRCESPALGRELKKIQAVPGRFWQEQYAGTNAIGLTLEVRRPCAVIRDEHYLDALAAIVCVAAPIVHPLTQRVRGVLALTTDAAADADLMLTAVGLAVRSIEQRLGADGSATERALLERFLARSRRAGVPVLAMSERVEFANPAANGALASSDRDLLWERARNAATMGPRVRVEVDLSGSRVEAEVEHVGGAEGPTGLVMEVTLPSSHRQPQIPATDRTDSLLDHGIIGHTETARYLRAEALRLAAKPVPVCVIGEPGSGKLTVARCIAGDARAVRPAVVDAARCPIDGEAKVLRLMAESVQHGAPTVIIRHIECLGVAGLAALAALATEFERVGTRLLMTRTTASGELSSYHDARVPGLSLRVPPLREHVDDILDLVPALVQRAGSSARARSPVLRALLRHDWPGNIAELALVVSELLERGGGELRAADLPHSVFHATWRRMGRLEQVERAAIIRALQESNGSKAGAAELLGIGRATVYRKMRSYGLSLDIGMP